MTTAPQRWDVTPRRGWAGGALLVVLALVAVNAVYGGIGVVAGAALVLWIAVQLLVLQRYFFLQPVIAGFGVLEMVLAWRWIHRSRTTT